MSLQVQYAAKLASASSGDQVHFGNSGAEANEGALKVAKRFTGALSSLDLRTPITAVPRRARCFW